MESWNQVSQGRFQRPLGANEQFIKFVGDRAHPAGREQWAVSIVATLRFPDNIPMTDLKRKLQDAWKLFRFRHPSIASTVVDDNGNGLVEYVIPDSKSLELWLDETFFIIDDPATSPEDLISKLRPSKYLTGYFFPSQHEVIIHTAHWRTDGYGAAYLLDAFLHAITTVLDNDGVPFIPWGEEVSRLVPSLETALKLPENDEPETVAAAEEYINTQSLMKNSVGIDYLGGLDTRPGGTRSVTLRVSKETTESFERACSELDLEIFSACHAALARFHFLQPSDSSSDDEKFFSSTIRLSMRPCLSPPYNGPAGACSIYTGGYRFQVSSSQSFNEIARQYLHQYKNGVTDPFIKSRRRFAMTVLDSLRGGTPPPNPPPSNIDVSIVNEADSIIKRFSSTKKGPLQVLKINIGVETLTRQPYLFLWKFDGQLNLALWYNEAYQNGDIASGILETVYDILKVELRVVD